MKAKYKIGMLLFYSTENAAMPETYSKVKAVVHHEDHAEYLMENDDHVSDSQVYEAFAPLATRKPAKKRGPRKAKGVEAESAG